MTDTLKNKRQREYPHKALKSALMCVSDGGMSFREAGKKNGVPHETVRRYYMDPSKKKMGKSTKFGEEEENAIAEILSHFARTKLPLSKPHLTEFITRLAIEKGLDPVMSNCWLRGFLQRHPHVVPRLTSNLDRKKAAEWTEENCNAYIDLLTSLDDRGYLDDPRGIFNLDVSSFMLGYERMIAFSPKGAKQMKFLSGGSTRDQVSVLFCGDATGKILRPCVLFDAQSHAGSMYENTANKLYVAVNDSGIMDPFVFTNYFKQEIFSNLVCEKNIVFFDGHYSHTTSNLQLLEACLKHNQISAKKVELLCFPSGQTDKLQPLDKVPFGGVKQKFKRYKNFYGIMDPNFEMSRHTFPGHLARLCTPGADLCSFDFTKSLPAGFRETGVFPFADQIIRDTVLKSIKEPDVFSKDSGAMLLIASILRHSLQLSETKIGVCLEAIVDIASDHRYLAESIRAAAEKSIVATKPKKQRRPKDRGLVLYKGALCLESGFVNAMRDKVKAKAAAAEEKKLVSQAKRAAAQDRKASLQMKKAAAEKKKVASQAKKVAVAEKKAGAEAKRAAVKAKIAATPSEAKTSKTPKVPRARKSVGEPKSPKKNKNKTKKS